MTDGSDVGAQAFDDFMEPGTVLHDGASMLVTEVPDRIYVLTAREAIGRSMLAKMLEVVWAAPNWRQPWGLVVVMGFNVGYDLSIRNHEMPADDRRAVGTAIASHNALHRMVVNTMAIPYRLVNRFQVSAHPTVAEAIAAQRRIVDEAERKGLPY